MKIIIIEGIATSGKTNLLNQFKTYFKQNKLNYLIIDEYEILMPILHNKSKDTALNHLNKIIEKYNFKKYDYILLDRFHITHIFRTKSQIKDFIKIENYLTQFDTKICLLKINIDKISERITNAMKHRPKEWETFVRKIGDDKQIFNYYKTQQDTLKQLLKNSKLKNKQFNTSLMDFEKTFNNILRFIK